MGWDCCGSLRVNGALLVGRRGRYGQMHGPGWWKGRLIQRDQSDSLEGIAT